MKADTKQLHLQKDQGWDEDSLIADEKVKKDE